MNFWCISILIAVKIIKYYTLSVNISIIALEITIFGMFKIFMQKIMFNMGF